MCFNVTGTTLASTDADGVVKLWDTRMTAEILTLHTGELTVTVTGPVGCVRKANGAGIHTEGSSIHRR